MDYKKPKWNKGLVCSKCGGRFYATSTQGHSVCPRCLYKKIQEEKNRNGK